jgi:indolepyruvate decarboxylase
MNTSPLSIGEYLIQRLYAHGVRHVFGVTGDYALTFYDQMVHSRLQVVNTCDEQGAGFAADAYARLRGLGVVCVTYCVGGLKVANTTAQAFAEKSPVVVISGAPGTKERVKDALLHHKVRDFDTQYKVFEQLTVASTVLDNPETAFREIDRVLAAALRYRRPVYIELPRDMVNTPGNSQYKPPEFCETSDPDTLREALHEARDMINASRNPVIIADVELHRFWLQDDLVQFVEKTNIPVAATIMGKSVMAENHPRYLGVYEGAMGRKDVCEYVEASDCLILLGVMMTDINLGIFTAHLDQKRSIYVTSEKVSIRYHNYEGIRLKDFVRGLIEMDIKKRNAGEMPHPKLPEPFRAERGKNITVDRLFQCINGFLDNDSIVITDVGDAMFAGSDLFIRNRTEFLSTAYYASLGFAVPASIGVQYAKPNLRPLVLVGDGAFQMTGMELSTVVRFKLCPIIVVLNNNGYGTERPMLDGPFNDLHEWKYSRIPEILGAGRGFDVKTEDQLEEALRAARGYREGFCILDVHLDKLDSSPALQRLSDSIKKRMK